MAYSTLAGLPPVAGLWACLAPLALYALVGSSRHLSVGPESITALMTATVIGPLAAGQLGRYATLAAALAVASPPNSSPSPGICPRYTSGRCCSAVPCWPSC